MLQHSGVAQPEDPATKSIIQRRQAVEICGGDSPKRKITRIPATRRSARETETEAQNYFESVLIPAHRLLTAPSRVGS
jgi:hypothetical protein